MAHRRARSALQETRVVPTVNVRRNVARSQIILVIALSTANECATFVALITLHVLISNVPANVALLTPTPQKVIVGHPEVARPGLMVTKHTVVYCTHYSQV
mmetsp:Transcript_19232/g.27396  ORF Transcript_19232/g.27396 Transcript_19232/m.27396 type:complete len:101 (-) Transcript_19232:2741-3043(-)